MRIVLASDENLVGPVGVCLKSLALSQDHRRVSVTVLCGEVSEASKAALSDYCKTLDLDVDLLDVDVSLVRRLAQTLPLQRFTFGALLRLLMGSILSSEDRALYIDADTLVLRDLAPMFEMELGEAIVAARPTPMDHLVDLGVPSSSYFNSGVMLIDLRKWRESGVEEAVFAAISEHAERLVYWDQCALNIVLRGKTAILPPSYNHIFDPSELPAGDHPIPHIIHFAGVWKPWPNAATVPWGEVYYRLSADTPWPVEYVPPMRLRRRMRLAAIASLEAIRHWRSSLSK